MKAYTKYIVILIIVFGLVNTIRVAMQASELPAVAAPVVEPAKVDFKGNYIAGSGIIEPKSELIEIASPIAGLVTQVFVEVGQKVKAGQPLFQIDSRGRAAELSVAENQLLVAQSKLDQTNRLFQIVESLRSKDTFAVSKDQYETRFGDLQIAKAELEKAKVDRDYIKAELDRLTVRSPIDSEILQSRVRAGEYAGGNSSSEALMIIGDTSSLNVRADIDENDAWRFINSGKSQGFIRGNPSLKLGLEFIRIEPYVIPKKSLNGGTVERVDTRVLQIIYKITNADTTPYVGQLVDVYLESK